MSQLFEKACPVWAKGLETEINITCGFHTAVEKEADKAYSLHVTASNFYRVYLNGSFFYYGPARSAHGIYRVDTLDLTAAMRDGRNDIAIEAVCYNINGFYAIDQPAFLQAELFVNGSSVAATAPDGAFTAFVLKQRRQKIQRFSFQRAIGESYILTPGVDDWRCGDFTGKEPACLVQTEAKQVIDRGIPLSDFTKVAPTEVVYRGKVRTGVIPESYHKDRSLTQISPELKGFKEDELEIHLSDEVQELAYTDKAAVGTPYSGKTVLSGKEFEILAMPGEKSGFIAMDIHCKEAGTLYIMVDETLIKEDVNPLSMECLNIIRLDVEPGSYSFQSFETFGFGYLKLVTVSGAFEVENVHIREYRYPAKLTRAYESSNPSLNKIYDAAIETFCQNAPDVFLDCPTRERAGWLCDSFFTARVEKALTGGNQMEKAFLENFILAKEFKHIPKGMLPMCYPADQYDGMFIPNWAMWFVIELEDYGQRNGDWAFVSRFKERVYDLLAYFKPFENEHGLLESLENWVFVEWSKSNELVQDVNFPTNMLYSYMLRKVGSMYDNPALTEQADRIAAVIRERSFDGTFFVDNELREDGRLRLSGERTETCQYYAFFCGVATPESHPALWEKLTKEFGPERLQKGLYPEIYPSNAFIGNYLRLDVLTRYGLHAQCNREIEGYFLKMAEKTGTLWENMTDYASCNHGFASYTIYLMEQNKR